MDHNNLCPGCFSDSSGQEPCPNCGYEDKTEEATLYLPTRTILAEKYLIGRVLGQGGFGITYLGWDMNLDMKLAVKEFFPQGLVSRLAGQSKVISLAGTEAHQFGYWQDRFLQEAKTLAQFEHHPNIVSVRDFFKANGTAYMIMSYVEGLTLDQYLAQAGGKLSFDKTIEVMMPVMDALREVHEVGVMHRDISPDNIFIDNRGRVVLLDFGAARQEISGQSKSISVILKAGYAPEEQYRSRGKQGPWTDVYAVGATIYRLLTGQVAPDAMDRLDEDTLKPPSELGVGIAAEQEAHLLKGLAIKAKNRYQTIDEFQEELLGSRVKPVTTIVTEFKKCPYCGEEISARAIKCKYCLSAIAEELTDPEMVLSEEKSPAEKPTAPPVISRENKEGPKPSVDTPAAMAEAFRETETVDLNCPVEVVDHSIETGNSATETTATIIFRNLSEKTIKALRLRIFCFDPFGEPVKHQGDNILEKNLLDFAASAKQLFGKDSPVELKNFSDTRKIKILVTSVLFSDDTRWDYDGSAHHEIETALLAGEELEKLKEAAGEDAICYARQEEAYWQCVCGRANLLDALKCLRCNRDIADTLKSLSSEKSVSAFLEKQRLEKEAEERRRQEDLRKKGEEAEHKRRLALQKTKRMSPIAAVLLVTIIAIFLVYQNIIQPARVYGSAVALMATGAYEEAAAVFEQLGDYRDSEEMLSFVLMAATKADYYIDYENGTIPIGDLPIGGRVVDPGWVWEFRAGSDYAREEGDQTKLVTWLVVAKDHYDDLEPHVTLLSEDLIGRHAFSETRNNHWGESDLRTWLNSTAFHRAFSRNFESALLTTTIQNRDWQNGSAYSTQDKVFIPSTTELGDTDHKQTYQIGKAYAYFQKADGEKRIAMLDGGPLWYWTRSPDLYDERSVLGVTSSGSFFYSGAYSGQNGVRPAINMKADTLVSKIRR